MQPVEGRYSLAITAVETNNAISKATGPAQQSGFSLGGNRLGPSEGQQWKYLHLRTLRRTLWLMILIAPVLR